MHNEGVKPFKCNICEFKTVDKNDSMRHIETFHERIKAIKCNICNQKFAKKGQKRYRCHL